MPYMNGDVPGTTGSSWEFLRRGGWNGWGPFEPGFTAGSTERMWVWINNQNGNCGTA